MVSPAAMAFTSKLYQFESNHNQYCAYVLFSCGSIFKYIVWNAYFHAIFATWICWSLCSSLVVYLKLVLVYVGKISYEKRKATIFTHGTAGIIVGISIGIVPNLISGIDNTSNFIILFSVVLILIVNFVIFTLIISSVLSCCKKSISTRNIRHYVSLIALAVICDSILILLVFLLFYSNLHGQSFEYPIMFIFTHRLVFQSMFVLLRRTTRTHWKLYFRKIKKRKVNRMIQL